MAGSVDSKLMHGGSGDAEIREYLRSPQGGSNGSRDDSGGEMFVKFETPRAARLALSAASSSVARRGVLGGYAVVRVGK